MPDKKPTRREAAIQAAASTASIIFENHSLLPTLYGFQDEHLHKIEDTLHIAVLTRGNVVELHGDAGPVKAGKEVLAHMYAQLEKGRPINLSDVEAAIRMKQTVPTQHTSGGGTTNTRGIVSELSLSTYKKTVVPYSHGQAEYMELLQKNDLVFGLGPAGTGKTYMAVAQAVHMFMNRQVQRIILSRPAVEAGEKLGFLPGDLKEKIDPYLRPLYDALYDMMPGEKVVQHMANNEIEVAPLAFMRGRTLSHAYIILDEAQNTTPIQMKMFLTRLGEGSRMVVTGDLSQVDLPKGVFSGLKDAIQRIENVEGVGMMRFTGEDVVRHPLAARIVKAYDEWDKTYSEDQYPTN